MNNLKQKFVLCEEFKQEKLGVSEYILILTFINLERLKSATTTVHVNSNCGQPLLTQNLLTPLRPQMFCVC